MRALSIGLMASLALAVPAQAKPVDSVTVHIPIGDLDLTTADGVAKLKQRSAFAIRRACAHQAADAWVSSDAEYNCRVSAMAEANRKIEQRRQTSLALLTSPVG
jgi:UrcA family protein